MRRDRQILDEAAELFFQKGFLAVTVDEIGAKAGVTGPAIYRHFASKDDILATLFDEAIDRAIELTSGTFDDPFEELEHRVRGFAAYVVDEQRLARVWMREHRSLSGPPARRHHRREAVFVGAWAHCIRRCFPSLSEDEAAAATWTAIGTMSSVAQWPPAPLGLDDLARRLAEFALAGLNALTPAPVDA